MNLFMLWFLSLVLAYLLGSLSWSYILARAIYKEDIRDKGSGNAGASNMTINHGWRLGVLVFALDFLKTFLLVKFLPQVSIVNETIGDQAFFLAIVAGLVSILGHVFPFWLNFKGGKGTASAIGLGFGISTKLGLIGLATIVLVTILTKYVALGGIALWISLAIGAYVFTKDLRILALLLLFTCVSIYLHRENIKRIINKEEVSLKFKYDDKDKEKK